MQLRLDLASRARSRARRRGRSQGTATVDVWWLPTFDLDLRPVSRGATARPPSSRRRARCRSSPQALSAPEAWKAVHAARRRPARQPRPGRRRGAASPIRWRRSRSRSRASPLETHIDRIGSAGVTRPPRRTSSCRRPRPARSGAVSTVTAPFSPGQFLALEGEKLLAALRASTTCRAGAASPRPPRRSSGRTATSRRALAHVLPRRGREPSVPRPFDPQHVRRRARRRTRSSAASSSSRENPYLLTSRQGQPATRRPRCRSCRPARRPSARSTTAAACSPTSV